MNREDFVTYEQALALKKLGFKELCLYNYDASKNFIPNSEIGNKDEGITTEDLLESYNFLEHKRIDAPTLSQVQKWLREKHIDINVCIDPLLREDIRKYVCNVYKTYDDHRTCCYHGWHESYEKALSTGITECIKILDNELD